MNESQKNKSDAAEVLNVLMNFAEEMLLNEGEFYPFAAAMLQDGTLEQIGINNENEFPSTETLVDDYEKLFIEGANKNEYKVTGVTYMAQRTNAESGLNEDLVVVKLDHIDDYSVIIFYSYTLEQTSDGKKVLFSEPGVHNGEGKIFSQSNPK